MDIRTRITLLLFMTLMACCQSGDDSTSRLKRQVTSDYVEMESAVRNALARQDVEQQIGIAIEKFFAQRFAAGSKGGCTVAVLDPQMHYITGRTLGSGQNEITIVESGLKDYQYLKDSFKGIEKGRISQNILYFNNNKIYVVARAVNQGPVVAGYLFFAYHAERFDKDWGIGDERFLSIDFGDGNK